MLVHHVRRFVTPALLALALASCSGGGPQGANPLVGSQPAQPIVQSTQTYTLTSADGTSVALTVNASTALPNSAVSFSDVSSDAATAGEERMKDDCRSIPPIRIKNPFRFPITIGIVGFTGTLHCISQTPLFGVTFYQVDPAPASISPIKLGDASVSGSRLTFVPAVQTLTLPARTVSEIVILPETSTSAVAFPVVPGTTTNLTPVASNLPTGSGLTFTYSTATGESLYSAACFAAYVNNVLAAPLQGVPLVGIPSFYCQITTPNGQPTTFGQTVAFNISLSRSDRAVFESDGQTQGYECTL